MAEQEESDELSSGSKQQIHLADLLLVQPEEPPESQNGLAVQERQEFIDGRQDYEIQESKRRLDRLQVENDDLRQNSELRRVFSGRVFALVCCWLTITVILVIAHGASGVAFHLSGSEFKWLVGSCTGLCFSLLSLVVSYFFPKKK
jgi:hypothetical protein